MYSHKLKTLVFPPSVRAATILLFVQSWVLGQGTFVNLDFEHPILPLSPGPAPVSSVFPGWNAYSSVGAFFNDISLGGPAISLHDANGSTRVFQGNYTALFQPGYPDGRTPALGQVGTVPSATQSLRFYGYGNFTLSFGTLQIPLVILASTPDYHILGGDFAAFANVTGELRIQGFGSLDNISFSDQPVPEPSTSGLLAFGAVLLAWRFLRKRTGLMPSRHRRSACPGRR